MSTPDAVCRVLVVEGRAHETTGHYPVTFARFAETLRELGCEVEVLTSQGWTLDGDPAFVPLDVHSYGPLAMLAKRVVERLSRIRWRALGRRLSPVASTVVLVGAARSRARRTGADAVIVVTFCDPVTASVVAGPGRWLCFAHSRARDLDVDGRAWGYRVLLRMSRRAEACRRRRAGDGLRIATTTEQGKHSWQARVPWCTSVTVPLGVTGVVPSDADPRAELGLPVGVRLALFFGVPHAGKDPETVWRAFRDLPEWRLVVAGRGSADVYRRWAAEQPDAGAGAGPAPILVDGYLDERTKHLLHRAADVAVLSFREAWIEDSGTLADALDCGTAVVCSAGSSTADRVDRLGLGAVYRAGDPAALVAAMRQLRDGPDPEGLVRARDEMSVRVSVTRCLDALRATEREGEPGG